MRGDRSALVGPSVGNDGASAQGIDAVCPKASTDEKMSTQMGLSRIFVNESSFSRLGMLVAEKYK